MSPVFDSSRRVALLGLGFFLAAHLRPVAAAEAGQAASASSNTCYWVFLNKGGDRQKVSTMAKEQVAKMQADHVGNLGTLYKQGRAFTAGPLGDNGFIRGIVVLNVPTPAAVKECFLADPFVQNNILAVEAYRWLADTSKFHKADEPFKLAKHTLGVVRKGKSFENLKEPVNSETLATLLPTLRRMPSGAEPAVAGPLVEAGDLLGVVLFMSEDVAKIESALSEDAAVKTGRVRIEFHPQFMGAGVLHTSG